MPIAKRPPSYRLHKARNCAVVTIDGRNHYLGKYGSPESHEAYARLIAGWRAGQAKPRESGNASNSISISELILTYWHFAKGHYRRNGKPTKELACMRDALRPLRQLYGTTPAAMFGPKALKAVRQHMIDSGLCRGVINHRVGRIKRMFKWAVAEELISPTVLHGLQAVTGLAFGRTEARETEPIKPVPDLYVTAVLPFVSPHVAAMIKLQRLTGMRPGELVLMRSADIDMSGEVWIYEPFDHKNRWRGHHKIIPLGPESQAILAPFLNRAPDVYLFSPAESEKWRLENEPPYHGRQRKTRVYPCEMKRRAKLKTVRKGRRNHKRPKRDRYDTSSYRRAIDYGLAKAKKAGFHLPHWHPHQLRHSLGTEIRKRYGIEAAQVVLGHARADVTQVYAEKNMEMAVKIMREVG